MKTLVIPDIHTKLTRVTAIIDKECKVDEIVCVGDYFDDFGDTPESNYDTAKWLDFFTAKENHIALIGNHELNYMYNACLYQCSGFSNSKLISINKGFKNWHRLKPYYETQGYILTHAGISNKLMPARGGFKKLKSQIDEQFELLKSRIIKPLFQCGVSRGGYLRWGGIIWGDYNYDFEPIKKVNQIFGHSPNEHPRNCAIIGSDNYCLDTHLNHYMLITDGKVKIKSYNE